MEPSVECVTTDAPEVTAAADALRRVRHAELILVLFVALGVLAAAAFSGWSAWQIRSCTTPTGSCYRTTVLRARAANRVLLQDLDRQHKVIQCLLLVPPPPTRSETDLTGCEAQFPPHN